MPTLIDAATAMIELLDQYDCDADLAAARSALNAAVVTELMQTLKSDVTAELEKTAQAVVKAPPGAKRGPERRVDYQAIRVAVAANNMLPKDQRRTRDEIAAEFGTSAVTVRKAMRTERQEQ